jgi:hypothetical protein
MEHSYCLAPKKVLDHLKVDPKKGLNDIEVRKRLQKYGYNGKSIDTTL